MTSNSQRPASECDLYPHRRRFAAPPSNAAAWRSLAARVSQTLAVRAVVGVALLLLGAVAGAAAGQRLATHAAHQAGACVALKMAAALGYLDAEQRRRVRNALVTAINPDADLFAGLRPSAPQACGEGTDT